MGRKAKRRQHGHGSVSKQKNRDTWVIQWRTDNGKRKTEGGFADETAARQRLAEIVADMGGPDREPALRKLNDYAADWLEERDETHASSYDDHKRWELHIRDTLGECRPNEVTASMLRAFILARRKKIAPGTVKLVFHLLSSLYSDLVESGDAKVNPCRLISKKTRAFMKSDHDAKNTPFLHDIADAIRLYHALYQREPVVGMAYAIGVLAGLRTSEVRALDWSHIDRKSGLIHVQVQAKGRLPAPLKDNDSRFVPVQPALQPILEAWAEREAGAGGKPVGLVCKPIPPRERKRSKRLRQFLDDHLMGKILREEIDRLGLGAVCSCCNEPAAWYQYTRHTYACHFIMAGGLIEELSRSLGHSTIALTQAHYIHLRPGFYSVSARNRLTADFGVPEAPSSGTAAPAGAGGEGVVSTPVPIPVQLADKLADKKIKTGEKLRLKMAGS